MSYCPNDDTGKCTRGQHTGMHGYLPDSSSLDVEPVEWGWVDPPAVIKGRRVTRKEFIDKVSPIKDSTSPATKTGPPDLSKFRRNDDPPNSHEAIKAYEPYRETAKGRVLDLLVKNLGTWLDNTDFAREEVGGFAGTRRLRELREEADENGLWYCIETRRKPGTKSVWQHRLLNRTS